MISRWDWRMAEREGLWGIGRAGKSKRYELTEYYT